MVWAGDVVWPTGVVELALVVVVVVFVVHAAPTITQEMIAASALALRTGLRDAGDVLLQDVAIGAQILP